MKTFGETQRASGRGHQQCRVCPIQLSRLKPGRNPTPTLTQPLNKSSIFYVCLCPRRTPSSVYCLYEHEDLHDHG
jgi:hypothetical protein